MSIGLLLACCVVLSVLLFWLIVIRPQKQRSIRQERANAALQKLYTKMHEVTHGDTFISVASEQGVVGRWQTFLALHARVNSISNNALLLQFEQEADRVIAEIDYEVQFVHTPSTIDEEIEKRQVLLSQAEAANAQLLVEAEQRFEETRAQLARDLEVERRRVAGLIDYLLAAKAKLVE